jgi:hypothetical protein
MVKVFYRAHYEKGETVSIHFSITYFLQSTPSGPKISAFVAGDEMALYRKYGLIE